MRRPIGGFAGRTYHIVGSLMSRLKYVFLEIIKYAHSTFLRQTLGLLGLEGGVLIRA